MSMRINLSQRKASEWWLLSILLYKDKVIDAQQCAIRVIVAKPLVSWFVDARKFFHLLSFF